MQPLPSLRLSISFSRRLAGLSLALLLAGPAALLAEVRLAGVFSDHMVLQQERELPVWGSASPGEKVRVEFAGVAAETLADAAGAWSLRLPALKASAEPRSLVVTGSNRVALEDVLVGEVWLCSGQSNMVYPLYKDQSAAEELPASSHPTIRLCQVSGRWAASPLHDRPLKWAVCAGEEAKRFSAVGYFFGRELQAQRGVPVGLILAAVSGTPAQCWTSLEGLRSSPDLSSYVDTYARLSTQAPKDGKSLAPGEVAGGTPSALFNGLISPLIPFGLRGVLWYQGESNTSDAALYTTLFTTMIRDWRGRWAQPELPFVFVQLPGFGRRNEDPRPSAWAELREAQTRVLALEGTAAVVSLDLSAKRNILHPTNKRELGRRLAVAAQAVAYGEPRAWRGAWPMAVDFNEGKAVAHFTDTAGGLRVGAQHPQDPAQPSEGGDPKGFLLAGEDHVFHRAEAHLEGDRVEVSCDAVPKPVALRYGWEDNPEVNLYGGDDLPVGPFRTDDWKQVLGAKEDPSKNAELKNAANPDFK